MNKKDLELSLRDGSYYKAMLGAEFITVVRHEGAIALFDVNGMEFPPSVKKLLMQRMRDRSKVATEKIVLEQNIRRANS